MRQTEEGFDEIAAEKVTGKESAQLPELQVMIKALRVVRGKECKYTHRLSLCDRGYPGRAESVDQVRIFESIENPH